MITQPKCHVGHLTDWQVILAIVMSGGRKDILRVLLWVVSLTCFGFNYQRIQINILFLTRGKQWVTLCTEALFKRFIDMNNYWDIMENNYKSKNTKTKTRFLFLHASLNSNLMPIFPCVWRISQLFRIMSNENCIRKHFHNKKILYFSVWS